VAAHVHGSDKESRFKTSKISHIGLCRVTDMNLMADTPQSVSSERGKFRVCPSGGSEHNENAHDVSLTPSRSHMLSHPTLIHIKTGRITALGSKRNCLGARGISGAEGGPAVPSTWRRQPPLTQTGRDATG